VSPDNRKDIMPIASPSSIAGALIDPPIKQILLDQRSVSNALTAFAGGGQTGSLLLTSSINRVTTVGTAADSVLLPPARAGVRVVVINAAAANSMNVFPSTGDAINALSANAAFALAANKSAEFVCAVDGTWNSILTA
jgi:hypothetical protein